MTHLFYFRLRVPINHPYLYYGFNGGNVTHADKSDKRVKSFDYSSWILNFYMKPKNE